MTLYINREALVKVTTTVAEYDTATEAFADCKEYNDSGDKAEYSVSTTPCREWEEARPKPLEDDDG